MEKSEMKTTDNTHLTATNKKAIAHLIANNIEAGKIGVISYFITTAQLVEILQHSHIPEEVEYALDILADRLPDVYKYY